MLAGEMRVPLTTGILIGIGETRRERIDALLALRDLAERFGHIQEIIVQNFRAKAGHEDGASPEPSMDELCWTIAVARLIFGPQHEHSGAAESLHGRPDRADPRRHQRLGRRVAGHARSRQPGGALAASRAAGRGDRARRPSCWSSGSRVVSALLIAARREWIDPALHRHVLRLSDGAGLARPGRWAPGLGGGRGARTMSAMSLQAGAGRGLRADRSRIVGAPSTACSSRNRESPRCSRRAVATSRDLSRPPTSCARPVGDAVSYVVTRNINYTNICLYHCGFCAFSKGKTHEALRGAAVRRGAARDPRGACARRGRAARPRSACRAASIRRSPGRPTSRICRAAKEAVPQIHVHAFSPLEVTHGARTLGLSIARVPASSCKAAGPGLAAGHRGRDPRRRDAPRVICPDKVTTQDGSTWCAQRTRSALPTTSTIMFGHLESYAHWARHLLRLRDLQQDTGGFTEFVPLPFVHMEAPLYRKGLARKGPTLREAILMHAVARLVLHPHFRNIQVSWVKLGPRWAQACLHAGANDLGGTLMNESISRAAGAAHGQELAPAADGGGDPRPRARAGAAHHAVSAGERGAARASLGAAAARANDRDQGRRPRGGAARRWRGVEAMLRLGYKASAEQFAPSELLDFACSRSRGRLRFGVHQRPFPALAAHRRACAVLAVVAGRARRAHLAHRDRHQRAHADVPLSPLGRRAGLRHAGR